MVLKWGSIFKYKIQKMNVGWFFSTCCLSHQVPFAPMAALSVPRSLTPMAYSPKLSHLLLFCWSLPIALVEDQRMGGEIEVRAVISPALFLPQHSSDSPALQFWLSFEFPAHIWGTLGNSTATLSHIFLNVNSIPQLSLGLSLFLLTFFIPTL